MKSRFVALLHGKGVIHFTCLYSWEHHKTLPFDNGRGRCSKRECREGNGEGIKRISTQQWGDNLESSQKLIAAKDFCEIWYGTYGETWPPSKLCGQVSPNGIKQYRSISWLLDSRLWVFVHWLSIYTFKRKWALTDGSVAVVHEVETTPLFREKVFANEAKFGVSLRRQEYRSTSSSNQRCCIVKS